MKSSPAPLAGAFFAVCGCAALLASGAAHAQASPVAPSTDLPNAPAAPLAPSVHQQAVAATPLPRIELWQGATQGMTLDQVKALFPNGSESFGPAEDDGSQPMWQMSGQVYGRGALVFFYFQRGGLTSVLAWVGGSKPHATVGNMADARALEHAFTGYYGKPTMCLDGTTGGLDQVDCRWEGHGLRIGLSYRDYGGASPHLAIAIRPLPPPPTAVTPFFGKRARKGS